MDVSNLNQKRIKEVAESGKRLDGRKLEDYREIIIETGVSKNAEGSARVKIGDTEVFVGVKIDVTEPYTDHEDEGTLITTAELLPLSSSDYEYGPPRIDAIEVARIVDRGIRESGFIDFKKLCIKKGEKVYGIFLDIYSINDSGNLIDAAALGAVAALKTAKIPKYDEEKEKIIYGELTSKSLPLSKSFPITITLHKFGESILVDPTKEEEETSDARLSLALNKEKEIRIRAAQKGKEGSISIEELEKMIKLATKKFKELESIVKKSLKD